MRIVDLRSDTVTLPTEEMLEAIKTTELGDDPTVNRLASKIVHGMDWFEVFSLRGRITKNKIGGFPSSRGDRFQDGRLDSGAFV